MPARRNSEVRKGRIARSALLALACALIALAAIPALAAAAPKEFTVNDTNVGPGNAGCETPGSLEECTLRGAIELANVNPGKDAIKFDRGVFGGAAPSATITLSVALPPITQEVEILGGRCPTGRFGTDFELIEGPCVELTLNATASTSILPVAANDVTIQGLAFEGAGNGIEVEEDDTGFTATNDWFGYGLNPGTGTANGTTGIRLDPGADEATIGGDQASERNVFGPGKFGVFVDGASKTKIRGNYIGVAPDGVTVAALETGVTIVDAQGAPPSKAEENEVGGVLTSGQVASLACDGACNVIEAEGVGVDLTDRGAPAVEAASGPTTIRGNYLGLGADGLTALGQGVYGVLAEPTVGLCGGGPGNVTVGGAAPTESNYFDGGVLAVYAEGTDNFRALGNSIGLLADGTEGSSPSFVGIEICAEGVTEPAQISSNHMLLTAGTTGINSDWGRAKITGNTIEGSEIGVRTGAESDGHGDLIQGNTITEPSTRGVLVGSDSNVVIGNTISKAGEGGILVETDADHNRIGGDAAGEANTIVGTLDPEPEEDGAIVMFGRQTGRNEIAANTGFGNPGPFIKLLGHGGSERPNGGIEPPVFATALQSSASGTAAANATVRIFSKASAEAGELGSLLKVVVADAAGNWAATYATLPVGTLVAATATSDAGTPEAGTSEVSAPQAATADPIVPVVPIIEPTDGGGGGGSGGSSSSSGSSTTTTTTAPPQAPKVKITKGPAKTSKSTTAKFKFTATPAAGAKFECRLDAKKWAKCKSPSTYKKLKPGRHTFQVRASVAGSPASKPAKYQFTVKP